MKTKLTTKNRATVIAPVMNGNGHIPKKLKPDQIQQLIIELDRVVPKNKNGSFDWKAIKKNFSKEWGQLMAGRNIGSLMVTVSKMRKNGILKNIRFSAKDKMRGKYTKPAQGFTPPPATTSAMHFCPCCGFNIGAVIKAVNAVQSLKVVRGGG